MNLRFACHSAYWFFYSWACRCNLSRNFIKRFTSIVRVHTIFCISQTVVCLQETGCFTQAFGSFQVLVMLSVMISHLKPDDQQRVNAPTLLHSPPHFHCGCHHTTS